MKTHLYIERHEDGETLVAVWRGGRPRLITKPTASTIRRINRLTRLPQYAVFAHFSKESTLVGIERREDI